ncbi:SubName: Full=Uncharacterized protein {ECO:0000313/EMBL:CCA73360.1} [Serendipita indica DSM 11827]|nr:SubName: Full=Uncharacterized protein {ECO:0000313/EMBL:CCA73360.1} [Serendipita indica DSM 11827]
MVLRRGHLTELLVKALLYIEVETHWQKPPGFCNEPFTLLGAHNCKYSAEKDTSALAYAIPGMGDDAQKRNGKNNDDDMEMTDSAINSEPPPAPELPISRQTLLYGHTQEVFCVSWAPEYADHVLLASGSKDSTAKIWKFTGIHHGNLATQLLDSIEHCNEEGYSGEDADVTCVDWSSDHLWLATASSDHFVRMWSVGEGKLKATLKGHTDSIAAVRFSPDSHFLLSSGYDGVVILWSLPAMRVQHRYEDGANKAFVADISWLTNNNFITTWTDNLIHVFTSSSTIPFRTFRGHTDEINSVRGSPDGKYIASVSDDLTVRIWNLETLRMEFKEGSLRPIAGSVGGNMGQNCIHTLRAHKSSITSCRWLQADWISGSSSTDGVKRLATMSDGGELGPAVCLWDAVAGVLLKSFNDHSAVTYGLCFHPTLPYMATGAMDGRLYIYDLKTLEMIWSWTDRTEPSSKVAIYEVDWSNDGKRLAACLSNGAVAVLDVTNLENSS